MTRGWLGVPALLVAAACSTSSSSSSSSSSGNTGDGGGSSTDTCRPAGGVCACASGCGSGTKAPSSMQCPQPPPGSGACGQECCIPSKLDASAFACGSSTCNTGEFCTRTVGGAQLDDGGTRESDACEPLPDQCQSDPTCTCVKANARQCSTQCADDGAGHVTVTCQAP
jgi:hypothetical protein